MGDGKRRALSGATNQASQSQGLEDQRAQEMKDQLSARRNAAQNQLEPVQSQVRGANTSQLATGGIDPEGLQRTRSAIDRTGTISSRLATTPTNDERGAGITAASYGRGREGYDELARTGGFNPEQSARFLRSSTAPVAAMYARMKDEQNRRGMTQGFTSSDARLLRGAANAGGEASTRANVELESQQRQGRLAGLGGLERTREAAGQEFQAGLNANTTALSAAGSLSGTEARNNLDLELGRARGVQDAINSTQRYLESVHGELTEADRMQISNRLAQLGMTQASINALLGSASQQASGLQTVSAIGGIAGNITHGATGGL